MRTNALMPLVSVTSPTYNRADTILRAIESVQNQTLRDWELLVVDDGSTDDTAGLIAARYAGEPRLKLIRQENHGVSAARNAGLRASSGKYLAFIDSDDEFLPHHLELESAFLESHPEENMVASELWKASDETPSLDTIRSKSGRCGAEGRKTAPR